jgi:hypothetical protein
MKISIGNTLRAFKPISFPRALYSNSPKPKIIVLVNPMYGRSEGLSETRRRIMRIDRYFIFRFTFCSLRNLKSSYVVSFFNYEVGYDDIGAKTLPVAE